jgi:hypothetical protein
MNKKVYLKIFIITLLTIIIAFIPRNVFAEVPSVSTAVNAMDGLSGSTIDDSTGGKLNNILNTVIGIIQVAGTGISMIMVTLLGIKYIMASPSDKADVKKQILPLVIGAIILFASVNLVGIVAKMSESTLSTL